jgi:hypothetical protein
MLQEDQKPLLGASNIIPAWIKLNQNHKGMMPVIPCCGPDWLGDGMSLAPARVVTEPEREQW